MAMPTGIARRELWIDARDLQSDSDPDNPMTPGEYKAALENRGRVKLAERQLSRSFEADVKTHEPTYAYGEDFQLGDKITVIDENLSVMADAIVTGMKRSASKDGENLELTFGYGQPTIYDILKRKAGK